jgi:uncharacterized protein YbjT (DUF2867 family)
MKKTILVAGATGETGRIIVNKLINRGFIPRVLVRDPGGARKILGAVPKIFKGDVREYDTLVPALEGVDVLISAVGTRTPVGKNCPKRVDYQGVANLVKAAGEAGVQRFILISSVAVTHPDHPLNRFGRILDWKRAGEEALQNSSLCYTIIRPGGLKNTPEGKKRLIVDQGDRILGMISRADLAETCLQALGCRHSERTTFEVIETDHKGPPDWSGLFSPLKND